MEAVYLKGNFYGVHCPKGHFSKESKMQIVPAGYYEILCRVNNTMKDIKVFLESTEEVGVRSIDNPDNVFVVEKECI